MFFEVLLAASYGLMLTVPRARVSAGAAYISINPAGLTLFLIGAALIYGVTGTLNFADLALKIPPRCRKPIAACCMPVRASRRRLPVVAAGMWPLNFGWRLPPILGQCASGGDVCDHDQGRRVHRAAPVEPVSAKCGCPALFEATG